MAIKLQRGRFQTMVKLLQLQLYKIEITHFSVGNNNHYFGVLQFIIHFRSSFSHVLYGISDQFGGCPYVCQLKLSPLLLRLSRFSRWVMCPYTPETQYYLGKWLLSRLCTYELPWRTREWRIIVPWAWTILSVNNPVYFIICIYRWRN